MRPGILAAMAAASILLSFGSASGTPAIGADSNLPVPRFVSLKAEGANGRHGPGLGHRVDWIYESETALLVRYRDRGIAVGAPHGPRSGVELRRFGQRVPEQRVELLESRLGEHWGSEVLIRWCRPGRYELHVPDPSGSYRAPPPMTVELEAGRTTVVDIALRPRGW